MGAVTMEAENHAGVPSGRPESDATLDKGVQRTDSEGSTNRMNWKDERTKGGPEVSSSAHETNGGALHLERIQVWGNLT